MSYNGKNVKITLEFKYNIFLKIWLLLLLHSFMYLE